MNFIFDVDGVLLQFLPTFQNFMEKEKGIVSAIPYYEEPDFYLSHMYPNLDANQVYQYISEMNCHPDYFPHLEPVNGAIEALKKIETLYPDAKISAVTSAGSAPETYTMRVENLAKIGFKGDITVLPLGGCKKAILSSFPEGSWFVDDLPKNLDVAKECGHNTILFSTKQNEIHHLDYRVAHTWDDCLNYFQTN